MGKDDLIYYCPRCGQETDIGASHELGDCIRALAEALAEVQRMLDRLEVDDG